MHAAADARPKARAQFSSSRPTAGRNASYRTSQVRVMGLASSRPVLGGRLSSSEAPTAGLALITPGVLRSFAAAAGGH